MFLGINSTFLCLMPANLEVSSFEIKNVYMFLGITSTFLYLIPANLGVSSFGIASCIFFFANYYNYMTMEKRGW